MSHLARALRCATVAAILSGAAFSGMGPANADANDTLAESLSKGYSLSNCTPAAQPPAGVAAAINCGQNADSAGPVKATYLLFNNADDLDGGFTNSIKDESLTACGNSGQSPTTWHQGNPPATAGKIACGTYQGAAEIIWSTDAKNVLSLIRASNADVPALYQWWKANG
ncbi:serine/threonine protein kinase [Mycobacterium asiaticum]|uniref:Serine/threonine protein kinase n=1 Tax=Mycobacterium asiaticum TaxID=1790 RepID=A0A1A3NMJ3_MYCAS|nr:serine/threonine protein kinase [Mycobacterium asiaticum]OBK22570.1 serine/threonine protein kinase [Mycobacterium asiaticum]